MHWLRWQSAVDFLVLAIAFYFLFLWAKETRALRLAFAIVSLYAAALTARHFDLLVTGWVLQGISLGALVLLIILFQPELRGALMHLDSILRLGLHPLGVAPEVCRVIAEAAFAMAEKRTGVLIVIPRKDSVQEIVKGGMRFGAEISKPVLESVFQKNSPLHDGAAVIEGSRVSEVCVVLPSTEREAVPDHFGTRHRAAIGLAERCDALVIVVSEERGIVSLAYGHELTPVQDSKTLVRALESSQEVEHLGLRNKLQRAFFANMKFKLAALGLAGIIWAVSSASIQTTVRTFSVPVEFRNVPAGMAISKQSAGRLDVQLRGNPWVMASIGATGLMVRFDLAGVAEGSHAIRVSQEAWPFRRDG